MSTHLDNHPEDDHLFLVTGCLWALVLTGVLIIIILALKDLTT